MSTDIEYNSINKSDHTEVFIEGGSKQKLITSKSFMKREPTVIKSGNRNTRISLSDVPPELAARLKHLDIGNDGYLDLEDILVLDEKEQLEEKTVILFIIIKSICFKKWDF